ncbi:Hypothetical predicted protein, partial [Marmota monax]
MPSVEGPEGKLMLIPASLKHCLLGTLLLSKLIAVFDEQEPLHKFESPSGNPADRQSPDAFETEVAAQLAAFKPIGGEIEVTPSALKLGTPLLVRRSSDPAPGPPADAQPSSSHPSGQSLKPVVL